MKHGITITVLISLVVLGCGQKPQRQLKVTYLSDPPGGALYRQNGELWGPCPKVLWYDLDEESLAAGELQVKGLIVRWPDGPQERSADLIKFPTDGGEQQFTFVQPEEPPADGTAKTADPVADAAESGIDSVQANSAQASGPGTAPGENEDRAAGEPTPTSPDDATDASKGRAGPAEDSGDPQPDVQASAAQAAIEPVVHPPEDPNGKGGQTEDRTKTIDFGNGVQIEFVLIPDGEFMMGPGPRERTDDPNEIKIQRVIISKPFYMSVYEVTQELYEKVMGTNPSRFPGLQRPVETVSWQDATNFCEKLSPEGGPQCRLPTEAEWEYACRAGTTTAYYWGGKFDSRYARTLADRKGETSDVGTKEPNDWGLFDMSGNVWEWCSDWYIDPRDPSTTRFRVLRGGSWGHGRLHCRSAQRNWHTPNHRYDDCGFRVVLEIEQTSEGPPES